MYNKESHRFQKLDDILQDELMAATMALSVLNAVYSPHPNSNPKLTLFDNTDYESALLQLDLSEVPQ